MCRRRRVEVDQSVGQKIAPPMLVPGHPGQKRHGVELQVRRRCHHANRIEQLLTDRRRERVVQRGRHLQAQQQKITQPNMEERRKQNAYSGNRADLVYGIEQYVQESFPEDAQLVAGRTGQGGRRCCLRALPRLQTLPHSANYVQLVLVHYAFLQRQTIFIRTRCL